MHKSGTAHAYLWTCKYFAWAKYEAGCAPSANVLRNVDLLVCPWRRLASIKKFLLALGLDFGLCPSSVFVCLVQKMTVLGSLCGQPAPRKLAVASQRRSYLCSCLLGEAFSSLGCAGPAARKHAPLSVRIIAVTGPTASCKCHKISPTSVCFSSSR